MLIHILGSLSLLFGLFIVTMSYIRQYRNAKNRDTGPYSSPAPFVGPIFVVAGYVMLPVEFSWWIFLVFLFDPDTVLIVAGILVLGWQSVFKKTTED